MISCSKPGLLVLTVFAIIFQSFGGIGGVANGFNHPFGPNEESMRAWFCHGKNQKDMVDRMCQASIVRSPAVRAVMELVDRGNYIPNNPYMDAPQAIGMGQTISAPHMHAHVLEQIHPYVDGKENIKMLDVGCGSGYLTAAFGRWLHNASESPILGSVASRNIHSSSPQVFGIDVHEHLIDLTIKNMQKKDIDLLESGTVRVQLGDGWKGLRKEAPFDVIHVGAAADGMPYELVSQLKVGGVMIIPIGSKDAIQTLYKIERINDVTDARNVRLKKVEEKGEKVAEFGFRAEDYKVIKLVGVRYVPLIKGQATERNIET